MPVTYKPTNVVNSPFIRYSGTSAYTMRNVSTIKASSFRKMVCKAMLIGGIPFELLDNKDACSMRHILEDGGEATLPKREVTDFIPQLLREEVSKIIAELGTGNFSKNLRLFSSFNAI